MAAGLTHSEQLALAGVAVIIAAGMMFQSFRSNPKEGVLAKPDSSWKEIDINSTANGAHATPAAIASAAPAEIMARAAGRLPENAEVTPTRIDLNTASQIEMERLPEIGKARAEAIIQHRDAIGGFREIGQLDDIPGIGPTFIKRLEPYVTISAIAPPKPTDMSAKEGSASAKTGVPRLTQPISINKATLKELQEIPGIGQALAQRIVAHRKRRPFRKIEDLKDVKGIGENNFQTMRPWITVE